MTIETVAVIASFSTSLGARFSSRSLNQVPLGPFTDMSGTFVWPESQGTASNLFVKLVLAVYNIF